MTSSEDFNDHLLGEDIERNNKSYKERKIKYFTEKEILLNDKWKVKVNVDRAKDKNCVKEYL